MQYLKNAEKIAVLHAKALGDFIVILPALRALKETYPQAEIVLLAKPWVTTFAEGRDMPFDRVISVPPIETVHDPSPPESQKFFAKMQDEQFDVAIQLQGGGQTTNPFVRRLNAKFTVGLKDAMAETLDANVPYVHYQSEVMRNLEVVALIGATTNYVEPELAVTKKDIAEARAAISWISEKPFAIIHAGADDIRRHWPAEKFAAVGDHLAEKGLAVVLTGTPKERDIITTVQAAMHHDTTACTELSIGGLAGLLSKADLVLSGDTGPLHVARAVGAKTVGLYWLPNLLNWGPITRTKHRTAIAMELPCPQCGIIPAKPWPFLPTTETCDHPFSFIENIEVSEVTSLANELLDD